MPIHLPHNLMYGCYPGGNAVRIILNVEAISVHFEKSLIQKFMPALSQEMRMSTTGVVYTFPEGKVVDQPQPLASVTPTRVEAKPVSEAAPVAELSPAVPELEQLEEADEFVEWEEADTVALMIVPEGEPESEPEPLDVFSAEVSSASTQESLITADEWGPGAALEQEHVQEVTEETIVPEPMTAAADMSELVAPVQDVPDREPSVEVNKAHEPAAISKKSPLEILKASAKKKRAKKIFAASDSRPLEPMLAAASTTSGEPDSLRREVEPLAAWSVYDERAAGKTWKRSIAYGATVAVLIAVYYFAGTSDKPPVEKSAQGTEPAKIEQAVVQPEQPKAETVPAKTKDELDKEKIEQARMVAEQARLDDEQAKAKADAERGIRAQAEIELQAKQEADAKRKADAKVKQTLVLSPLTEEQTGSDRPADKSRAPLELEIPANKPVDIDEYVVQEGDTLWSISQRFTGSPYNYPRIAGENRIAEPDLIFPGQRIRLIK
jgi:LysM repeat protein